MRILSAKRLVRAVLARGIVRSGLGLMAATTAASATAIRNSQSSTAQSSTVHSGNAVKVRYGCTKAEPGKTEKTGRMVMVCERRVRRYQ